MTIELGHPTAGVALDAGQVAAIRALAARDFEPPTSTTMVSCLDPEEQPVKRGFRAVRAADGREGFEIDLPSDVAGFSASDNALPVLIDGDTRRQVGGVKLSQDGRAIAKFSQSENGVEARRRFVSGEAALHVAYLSQGAGRRAAALSLRAVSDGKHAKGGTMSDQQEIARLGAKHNRHDLATAAIAAGQSLDAFRSDLLGAIGTKPLDDSPLSAPAFHRGGEREYSLGNVLRAHITGDWSQAGFEREMSQEATRRYPGQSRGLVVPAEAVLGTRATVTSTGGAAGAITTDLHPGSFIDRLRPASAVMQAGATVMSGESRNFTIPKLAADATAAWLAEGSSVSDSSIDVDSINLSMKRVSASQSFTREALLQSQPSIDEIIRRSIGATLMQAIDLAGLEGTGTSGQPTGVANTSGVNTLTAAGNTITRLEALNALAAIEADNVPTADAVWVMHPNDAARIANETIDAGSGRFVIDEQTPGMIGRRVVQTTKATEGTVYLGVWEHLIVAMFGGVDLIVDPYTAATSAKVAITSHMMADVNVRHAEAFNVVTLTTA